MNKYIGARYVPIFDSEASWKKTKPYEPLTIVSYQGDSYTSKTYVPTNIDITNTLYWAHTGNYNAQVEQYRQNVENVTVDLNNQILGIQNSKVDKVDGKGLSSNDYSAAEMAKVAGAVTDIDMLQLQISSVVSGAPKVATLASEMTDLAKTYVYTGAEAEHTNGHWYWYNGTAWTDGGQYFDSAITANLSKEIDNNVSCFEQQSDVNKIITNVVVVGSSGRRYAIGNINNNFSSFTGCVIYYTDDECTTLTNGKTITFVGTSGDMTVLLANGDTISFHFDVSFMADNTRIGTIAGKNILVSKNRYLFNGAMNTLNCFEDASGASVIISNVKVNGSTVNRYAIANINNNYTGFTGCLIYSSNDNGDLVSTLKTITFTATSGDISTTLTNGDIITFHYDISTLASGTRTSIVAGKTALISLKCYIPRYISSLDFNDFSGISMFQTIGAVGDSYASGQIYKWNGSSYDVGNYYPLSWGQNIARMNGATCVNFASGGLTTKTWLTADRGLPLVKATAAQQLYLIALGINDVNTLGTSYLGTISDITPTYANNPDTFYGNMARIIEQIKEYAPNAKIILSTMATNTGDFLTYNQAIIAIANHYGIAYIEQYNDTFFTGSFYKDNLISGHPTAPVYVGMAKAFMRLINKCMQNNLNYFKDYLG